MSSIKKLAGQTLWYGLPTIASRFLGYLMNLSLPLFFAQPANTADLTQVYAIIPFLNVLFTYGLETAYFRYSSSKDRNTLYSTLSLSLFSSTIFFTALLFFLQSDLAGWARLEERPEFIAYMAGILFFDAICTLAFARLRMEERPRKYAFARISGVVINLLVVLLFLGVIPNYWKEDPSSFPGSWYNPDMGVGYYLIGNLLGSIITFLILIPEYRSIKFRFDSKIWKEIMAYSYPLVIVGMGGMINDMLSRLIYQHVVDLPVEEAKHELGIFGNIFRLAVLITIMIQAFRMAAEPFFFRQASGDNPQRTYARVMKFFVIASCFLFLLLSLYIDLFAWFFMAIDKPLWVEGLEVVPLLALGNVFLGIYYNLSIWYKLTNRNLWGAGITLAGAAITIVLNIWLIPELHYLGAALATFCCYLFMMVASYLLGQKFYPVPYAWKKLTAYLVISVMLYGLHKAALWLYNDRVFNLASATLLFLVFVILVGRVEKKELQKLPLVRKLYRSSPPNN